MQPGSFLPPGAKLNMWGEQLLVTIGIRQDLLRVIFAKPPSADPPADAAVSEAPTAQDFQSVVSQYYPNMTLGEPLWLNAFRIHRRGVQRWVRAVAPALGGSPTRNMPDGWTSAPWQVP
jgi:hypothetical protein